MKKLAIAVLLSSSVSFATTATNAATKEVKFVGDLEFAPLCEAIVNDDLSLLKTSLNHFVGDLGVSDRSVLRRVAKNTGVKCDGKTLVEFSNERNASEVKSFLKSNRV